MPQVTVYNKTRAVIYPLGDIGQNTSVRPGSYLLRSHYFKRNGLEVAWIAVPGYQDWVALMLEPGDPRTWDVSEDAKTTDYRR